MVENPQPHPKTNNAEILKMRTKLICFFLTTVAVALPTIADVNVKGEIDRFSTLPKSEACRRIDFTEVQIIPGFINDTWFAVVSGTKPWLTMDVDLRPLIYIAQPDYWGIEVIGCQSGAGLPSTGPYLTSLQVGGLGKLGVEIIGATTSVKKTVPPN